MARTTGYPTVIIAKMILNNEVELGTGVVYPEFIGLREDGTAEKIIDELRGYGIEIEIKEQ